jgi:hypothetical protein
MAGEGAKRCPTNFSLSQSFDKLKLVGHQTALHEKDIRFGDEWIT